LIAEEAELRALMLAGLAGDAAAYRALLSLLGIHLRAYFRRRLGHDAADAEDLVQESLMAMHARRATYDASQPLTAWVHAIARYKLIDHLRRRKLRRTLPLDDAAAVFSGDDAEAASARHDIDRLLAALPPKPRALIEAVKIEGLSMAEAGARNAMSETAVKVSVHRGLKALAAKIRGEDRADG
jgi:RNA polymerase sigma-70 factor (ECF subfamily)